MNVFVTGASGFVGEEILRQLHEAGHSIRMLARRPQSDIVQEDATRYHAEVYPGNIIEGASLLDGFKNIDAVIHLVGIISEVGGNTFENVHICGTQNIVAATQQAGVKRFVHMSALGTRPNAASRYHQSKWAAEEIVRASGLDYTIFRPSIIYGPADHFVNLFAKMARFSPVIPVMGEGGATLQPVPVADVAACFVKALNESAAIGQTFDLCGKNVLAFTEVVDCILQVTGRKRWKIHIPMRLGQLQAALFEFIFPKVLGKAPPLNRDQLIMLSEDNTGNPNPANDLFGLKPGSFQQGISGYLKQ